MTERIQGSRQIPSGSDYTPDEGVTLAPVRNADGSAGPVRQVTTGASSYARQSITMTASGWAVRDDIGGDPARERGTLRRTGATAASVQAEARAQVRTRIQALLDEANRQPTGPLSQQRMPAPPERTLAQTIAQQRSNAFRQGAVDTGLTATGVLLGGAGEHVAERVAERAVHHAAHGVLATRGPRAVQVLATAGGVLGPLPTTAAHVAHAGHAPGAATRGEAAAMGALEIGAHAALGVAGAAAVGGLLLLGRMVSRIAADGQERRQVAQSESEYIRARDAVLAEERQHRSEGAADAALAARNEGRIDFARMARDGDYAIGVRQQLTTLLRD